MKFDKINNKGQARIFENPFLESLTKGHPAVIWGMYIPILSFILYWGYSRYELSIFQLASLFVLGIVFWTFFEYIAHRFLFHLISDSPKLQRIAYIFHGNHHHYPRDRQRLFMPPVPSILLASFIIAVQYLFLGKYVFGFFPGFMIGYLLYASMHYAIHAFAPPFKFLKPLWSNHHLHHYKDENLGFGVSNLLWDKVFNTTFDLNKVKEDKEKVKELMFEKKSDKM